MVPKFRQKKMWEEIIPKLQINEVPHRFVSQIKMFMSNNEVILAKNRVEFKQLMRENAENNIMVTNINFSINYPRLIKRVETEYERILKK